MGYVLALLFCIICIVMYKINRHQEILIDRLAYELQKLEVKYIDLKLKNKELSDNLEKKIN
jgi:preprotein translocase subunit SecG